MLNCTTLFLQLIDLCGHDEIAFGEAIDFVSPESDLHFTPGEKNVGMMSLLLGDFPDTVHKSQRGFEIGKSVGAGDMVLVHNFPMREVGQLFVDVGEFFSFERRDASAAGNAGLSGK